MERVLLIRVGLRDGIDPSLKWNERFNILLEKVSSVVGEIVKIGQDAHSMSGRDFFSECAEIQWNLDITILDITMFPV